MSSQTITGPDGQRRCAWCAATPAYMRYHDSEWGFPVADDIRLFEKLCLESFQAGLSWRTILAKRENFRAAFAGFDFNILAGFGPMQMERLLQDPGIVRHRGKIAAVLHNAHRAKELVQEAGSLAAFLWRFAPPPGSPAPAQPVATSPEAIALAQNLRQRGWKFLGPTTLYAFMQAMGLVNDHVADCAFRARAAAARAAFRPPF
jgi:DNA-3-methyladenine glycosylase I